ncbi:MAG: hypothetical protein M3362_15400 [Acidobacteriota bacterium]|nr:hypothetical protein [Acidobacteriota bacterium]
MKDEGGNDEVKTDIHPSAFILTCVTLSAVPFNDNDSNSEDALAGAGYEGDCSPSAFILPP